MIMQFRNLLFCLSVISILAALPEKPNVLFIISDDLTATALSCYGNPICKTPNIDKLAGQGTRYTRAYCQATFCGPSRASFMFGYYPHASPSVGQRAGRGRNAVGAERESWAEYFKNKGYHTARISKIFHMGVPSNIEKGIDGKDDPASWVEKYNSRGPEWKAAGTGETLQKNPDGKKPVHGGNTFVVVEADGDDLVHSDGKTAAKAVELLDKYTAMDKPFFLALGFVRPHVPFVAPRKYFEPYLPYSKIPLPE
jgi:iduronate 2-sulfatase